MNKKFSKDLLTFTKDGIYCRQADVYIDALNQVDTNIITHAHSDHARGGSVKYIAHQYSVPILKYRLGNINVKGIKYNEPFEINGVKFSLHPAGHIIGSSQIRIEYQGEVWVVTGDYKLTDDGISIPYEVVKCDVLVTESTFGMPIFKWPNQYEVFDEINNWWKRNQGKRTSILGCYSLGKAQRILKNIDPSIGPIFAHGSIVNTTNIFRENGIDLPKLQKFETVNKDDLKNALILAPPSSTDSYWMKNFPLYSLGFASGWMAVRGTRRQRAIDQGFVLSDHCDWDELNKAVELTEAQKVYVRHGYSAIFSRWLKEKGVDAIDSASHSYAL